MENNTVIETTIETPIETIDNPVVEANDTVVTTSAWKFGIASAAIGIGAVMAVRHFVKSRDARQAKREKKMLKHLRKKGYTITEPDEEVEVNEDVPEEPEVTAEPTKTTPKAKKRK